jgi:hypothetical protein
MNKQIEINKNVALEIVPRKTVGFYYMVKNPKAFTGTSFIGNFDQLMMKRYAGLRQFWNVTEEEFLQTIGVVA